MADDSGSPPWQLEQTDTLPRWQSLRNLINSGGHSGVELQRARDAFDREMSERSMEEGQASIERRRRSPESHIQEHLQRAQQFSSPAPEPFLAGNTAASMVRARRRAVRPSQRLQRYMDVYGETNRETRSEAPDSLTSPRRLTPPFMTTGTLLDEYIAGSQASRDQRYRVKRRKLDDGTFDDESKIVKYGDQGRVTPGPLKMEIVGHDGIDSVEASKGMMQNVLQNDSTFYTRKSNRFNIVLKHLGAMPFSLTKVVFKAPSHGYEAYIQEGMIFVAMEDDKLLEKTSQYEACHSSKSYRDHHHHHHHHHHQRQNDLYRPGLPWSSQLSRSPLRSIDRPRHLRDPYTHWFRSGENDSELENAIVPGFDVCLTETSDSDEDLWFAPYSPPRWRENSSVRQQHPYTDRYRPNYTDDLSYVELSGTSDESDDEETSFRPSQLSGDRDFQANIRDARRSLHRMRYLHDRVHDGWQDLHNFVHARPASSTADSRNVTVQEHSRTPTSTTPTTAKLQSDHTSEQTVQQTSDAIKPHARFVVSRHRSSVAVSFDPPVSGRYILLKLWTPCPNATIDIQNITIHGYGGPRFFPAYEFR